MAARSPEMEILQEGIEQGMGLLDLEKYVQQYQPEFTFFKLMSNPGRIQHAEDKLLLKEIRSSVAVIQMRAAERFAHTGMKSRATQIMKQTPEEFLQQNLHKEKGLAKPPETPNDTFYEEMTQRRIDENMEFTRADNPNLEVRSKINKLLRNAELEEAIAVGGREFDPEGLAELQRAIAEHSRPQSEMTDMEYLDQLEYHSKLQNDFLESLEHERWDDLNMDDAFDDLTNEYNESKTTLDSMKQMTGDDLDALLDRLSNQPHPPEVQGKVAPHTDRAMDELNDIPRKAGDTGDPFDRVPRDFENWGIERQMQYTKTKASKWGEYFIKQDVYDFPDLNAEQRMLEMQNFNKPSSKYF